MRSRSKVLTVGLITYGVFVLSLSLGAQQPAVNDEDCIGNSPGCLPVACNAPSIHSSTSCEETSPVPHKMCAQFYGKNCTKKTRTCGNIDEYLGNNQCQNNKCVNALYNITSFKTTPNGC